MYQFYYVFVKKKCRNPASLLTDRDSLCFETEEDFYEILHEFKELFDLSNFPKDSKIFCNDNKKVPGKMKDDYGAMAIYVNNYEKSVYKGHNSNIRHDEFIDVHSNKKVIRLI